MAEHKTETATPDERTRTEALASVLSSAKALEVLNEQARRESMQLPAKRLDDARTYIEANGAYFHLRDNGDGTVTPVDPNGKELGDAVKAGEPVQVKG